MTRSPADDHPANGPRDDARTRTRTTRKRRVPVSQSGTGVESPGQTDSATTTQPVGSPARDYSWAPFEQGNTAALVHGATSPRAIAERAEAVHGELLQHAPYLAEAKFIPAVSRYLKAAARECLLHEHIERVSEQQGVGKVPARTWEQATAAARLAARLGSDLGLDPLGHARIRALSAGAEVSESLHDLAAEGRAIRERAQRRREAALAPVVELHGTDDQEDQDRG